MVFQNIPQVSDACFGIPFAIKGPKGSKAMEGSKARSLVEIVAQPSAVASLAFATIIIYAQSPGARVEHLVAIGIADVTVEDVFRHTAVGQIELVVVVIASQLGGREGIEGRTCHDKLVVDVASAVVPEDGSAVADKLATCGIASATRTHKVDTRTAQVEVGMIVHSSILTP